MPSSIPRVRYRSVAGVAIVTGVLVLLSLPSARAVHAASRVQVAQSPSAPAEQRMMVLLFDLSSMAAEDVSRSATAAGDFIDTAGRGDLVSVVTLDSRLRVASDFTSDAAVLRAVLADLPNGVRNATVTPQPADAPEPRLSAMKTLCQTLAPLQQRKALLYFSAGLARSDTVDQAALNDATNSCRRANVLIYPVDTRGLAAIAGVRTPGGVGLFNGIPK